MRGVSLRTVMAEWGRIGVIGFGGPAAHVALLRELTVEQRRWLEPREFEDAFAACQLLPGPASTQLSIYTARRVAGNAGALVGGLAFILPGLLVTLAIAAVALASRPSASVRGVGAGAAAAVVAVVAHAGIGLARSSLQGRDRHATLRAIAYGLAGGVAAIVAGQAVVLAILAAGVVELTWRRHRAAPALHAWPLLLPLAMLRAAELPPLAWTAFKVGGLAYGGGFVGIPLMQDDAIAHHWMSAETFASAVAYGQVTPGPVTHTVALVGWAASGLAGALLASVVAFAPSFAFVLLGAGRFDRLRGGAGPRTFLDGAGPAAVGAILGASVLLLGALGPAWQFAVLALAALALIFRAPALAVLLGGALAGLLAAAAGLHAPG